jgi:hypothetical protein
MHTADINSLSIDRRCHYKCPTPPTCTWPASHTHTQTVTFSLSLPLSLSNTTAHSFYARDAYRCLSCTLLCLRPVELCTVYCVIALCTVLCIVYVLCTVRSVLVLNNPTNTHDSATTGGVVARAQSFQVLGVDFDLDEDFVPWFLEVDTPFLVAFCRSKFSLFFIAPTMCFLVLLLRFSPLLKKKLFGTDNRRMSRLRWDFRQRLRRRRRRPCSTPLQRWCLAWAWTTRLSWPSDPPSRASVGSRCRALRWSHTHAHTHAHTAMSDSDTRCAQFFLPRFICSLLFATSVVFLRCERIRAATDKASMVGTNEYWCKPWTLRHIRSANEALCVCMVGESEYYAIQLCAFAWSARANTMRYSSVRLHGRRERILCDTALCACMVGENEYYTIHQV